MEENVIKNFIINASYFEVLNYRKEDKKPIIAEYEENQWSYIVEIMIVTIKSLMPSQSDNGNIINYERFSKELELWKSYRHGYNRNLMDSINKTYSKNYWTEIDETIYSRVSIITLANQEWEIIKNEIIKNILYTSGNIEVMIECLLLSKILYLMIEHKDYEYENILNHLKQEIINFSQTELDNSEQSYKMPKDKYEKNYKIEFERTKIEMISLLNEINLNDKFVVLRKTLKLLKEYDEDLADVYFINGIKGIIDGKIISKNIKDITFIENLCSYITKLRKGRIDSKGLVIKEYILDDVFRYQEGEKFDHSLLNSCKVLHTEQREKFFISYIKTVSGIYRFVKVNNQ